MNYIDFIWLSIGTALFITLVIAEHWHSKQGKQLYRLIENHRDYRHLQLREMKSMALGSLMQLILRDLLREDPLFRQHWRIGFLVLLPIANFYFLASFQKQLDLAEQECKLEQSSMTYTEL